MPAKEPPVPSVWTRADQQRQRPALSRAQIVSEAVRLLDTEGISGLSMRRLGTRLGAGATSLYRHVASKDELMELAIDAVYGELSLPKVADPADWRAGATRIAHQLRALILEHPWIVAVSAETGLSYLGPNVMRISEDLLAMFVAAGCTVDNADLAIKTIINYVTGATSSEAALLLKLTSLGLDMRQWADSLWDAAERAARPYPYTHQLHAVYRGKDPRDITETHFTQQLEFVLDGLAQLIHRPAMATTKPTPI